jgi:hypothetical protein
VRRGEDVDDRCRCSVKRGGAFGLVPRFRSKLRQLSYLHARHGFIYLTTNIDTAYNRILYLSHESYVVAISDKSWR